MGSAPSRPPPWLAKKDSDKVVHNQGNRFAGDPRESHCDSLKTRHSQDRTLEDLDHNPSSDTQRKEKRKLTVPNVLRDEQARDTPPLSSEGRKIRKVDMSDPKIPFSFLDQKKAQEETLDDTSSEKLDLTESDEASLTSRVGASRSRECQIRFPVEASLKQIAELADQIASPPYPVEALSEYLQCQTADRLFSCNEAAGLFLVTSTWQLKDSESENLLDHVLSRLSTTEAVPMSLKIRLVKSVKDRGWSAAANGSCRSYIEERLDQLSVDRIYSFMGTYDLLLCFKDLPDSEFIVTYVHEIQRTLDDIHSDPPIQVIDDHEDTAAGEIPRLLMEMLQVHDWCAMEPIIKLCLPHLSDILNASLVVLDQKAAALTVIKDKFPNWDIELECKSIVQAILQGLEAFSKDGQHEEKSVFTSKIQGENIVRFLLDHMDLKSYMRLFDWIQTAPGSELELFHLALEKIAHHGNASEVHVEPSMLKQFRDALRSRVLKDLQRDEKILFDDTRDGAPLFSWRMPQAKASCRALVEFLHSPAVGPKLIKIEGGNKEARRLASANSRMKDYIKLGYSAQIIATGSLSMIRVQKTRAYYNAVMKRHCMSTNALHDIQTAIKSLGGSVLKRSDVQGKKAAPPPRKRRKKNLAPIPMDAEIIELL